MRPLILLFLLGPPALAAPERAVVYRGGELGSEANLHPLTLYLNLAFDTTQNPY